MALPQNDASFFWKDISPANVYQHQLTQFTACLQQYSGMGTLPFFVFTDRLPDREQLDYLFRDLTGKEPPQLPFVLVVQKAGKADVRSLWGYLGHHLYDVLEWTGEADLITYVQALVGRSRKVDAVLQSAMVKRNLVGESAVWKAFLREVVEATLFGQGSILFVGASGTGKELLSRLVHTIDERPHKKELVLLDCTTIVPDLAGSEFFGHERGSYTNAVQSREGAFSLAHEGTLFLDEISELPLPLQAELLRVIQEGKFKKVGSNTWHTTRFRLVCATNKDLRRLVEEGRFRQDLYFRLADFEFRVPSLQERMEDVPLLARHFLREFCGSESCPELDDAVLDYLLSRTYPGNVRELRQLVRRMALKHIHPNRITMGEVPLQDRPAAEIEATAVGKESFRSALRTAILSGSTLWQLKNRTMEDAIQIALDLSNGNKDLAAHRLGVTWRAILQFRKKNKGKVL